MPERPRVLHLGPDPRIGGGMAAALRGLLESPLAAEYRLEVVPTYRGPGRLERLLVFTVALVRLAVWSLRGRGRIVHVHATVRGSAYRKSVCVLAAKALRRRVVLHIHSGPGDIDAFADRLSGTRGALVRAGCARADVVLAVSRASVAAIGRAYGAEDVIAVPNPAPPAPAFVRKDFGDDGVVRAAYLGGFANPIKGGEVMLEALRVGADRRGGRLAVTLAGPGEPPDGAGSLAGGDSVEWVGWLGPAEKDELLRAAQIFVMPSLSEGLPMALLEAMTYGMAIVATEVGGIPEVIESGCDGLLVPAGDPAALAAALDRLVDEPELCERIARAARERVRSLDAVEVAAPLAAIYASLA